MRRQWRWVLPLVAMTLLAGCGEPGTVGVESRGVCAYTVMFQGRAYTHFGTSSDLASPVEPGRKLGTARVVPCSADADGPPDSDLVIHEIVGSPPREEIYAEGRGVFRANDYDEIHESP